MSKILAEPDVTSFFVATAKRNYKKKKKSGNKDQALNNITGPTRYGIDAEKLSSKCLLSLTTKLLACIAFVSYPFSMHRRNAHSEHEVGGQRRWGAGFVGIGCLY